MATLRNTKWRALHIGPWSPSSGQRSWVLLRNPQHQCGWPQGVEAFCPSIMRSVLSVADTFGAGVRPAVANRWLAHVSLRCQFAAPKVW